LKRAGRVCRSDLNLSLLREVKDLKNRDLIFKSITFEEVID